MFITYNGRSDVRTISAADFTAAGLTSATKVWNKANGFTIDLPPDIAAFVLAQGEFYAESGEVFGDVLGGGAVTPKVLVFDGSPKSIFGGKFWTEGVNLGTFFWEFLCRFDGNTHPNAGGYLISEGYGGAHALLFGISGSPQGNIYTGSTITSFSSRYTAEVGEWLDVAIGWDGDLIYIWVNGILVGVQPFAGPRQAQGGGVYGTLFLGGSDHSNFQGAIAQARGFENVAESDPIPNLSAGVIGCAYVPEPVKGSIVGNRIASSLIPSYAVDAQSGSSLLLDAGKGYDNKLHHSKLVGHFGPPPQYEEDSTFPSLVYPVTRTRTPTPPAPVPSGCKIFDSFPGEDSIPYFTSFANPPGYEVTSLGSTQGGSLGPLPWINDNENAPGNMWGKHDGRAVFTGTYIGATWVQNDSPNMDVRCTRDNASGISIPSAAGYAGAIQSADIALALRVLDANNLLFTMTYHDQYGNNFCRLFSRVAGADTQLEQWNFGTYVWSVLRLVASGTTIECYIDATKIGEANGVTAHQTRTGVGLWQHLQSSGSALGWKNFTVF